MKTVQEISRSLGNFIVEYSYIGTLNMRRTPMIGYYRCWAESEQDAADRFRTTQRNFKSDCCNVLRVWTKGEGVTA
jgi:hypothetical protein